MRKFLLSFLMALATISMVKAAEITIDPDGTGVTWTAATDDTYGKGFKTSTNGLTVGLYKYKGTVDIVTPTDLLKVYKNSVLVIEAEDGSNITGVELTASASKYCLDMAVVGTEETAKADTKTLKISWTGSQKTFVLQASNGQVRTSGIVVTTLKDGSIAAPKFSVAEGTYYEKQSVTITNPNTTGKIYYTLDGSEPTASSTEYTAPIEISETKTLKAIVIDGEKKSAVTTAVYTIAQVKTVNTVAEFLKLTKGEKAKFANPVVVAAVYTAKSGSVSYYCSDETGGIQLYDKTGKEMPAYKVDDVIPAGFEAEYDLYNGVPEAVSVSGAVAATETKVAPFTVTTIEEISKDMVGAIVQIKGASIKEISGSNFSVSDETGALASYNKFGLEDLKEATGVVVKAVVNIYSNNLQLMPFDIDYSSAVVEVEDSEKVEVVPGTGEIYVNGAGDVNIYNIDGRRTTTVKGSGDIPPKKKSHVIETESGVYIVVVEGEAVKVKVD